MTLPAAEKAQQVITLCTYLSSFIHSLLSLSLMADTCQGNEINIQGLYLHHTCLGPNANQAAVIDGKLAANNWTVYDGPGPNAKLVARAQGLHIDAGNWHNSFSLVFENGRYVRHTVQYVCA